MKASWFTSLSAALALAACFTATSIAVAQGSLTPPAGPPAPTMKTLDQIEPRIDLQNAPASAVNTLDGDFQYIITQPGSYYLTANIVVTKSYGIQISAEGVTLDLNGFQISREVALGYGIVIAANGVSVRNGSIKGFGTGVLGQVQGVSLRDLALRDLAVSNCTGSGIVVFGETVLETCRIHDNRVDDDNGGDFGIGIFGKGTLNNCTVVNNVVKIGIWLENGSVARGCTVSHNKCDFGFQTIFASYLVHCTAHNNTGKEFFSGGTGGFLILGGGTVSQCSSFANDNTSTQTTTSGMGFYLVGAAAIQDCSAYGNQGDGIQLIHFSEVRTNVRNNLCYSNGSNGDGAGIHASGTGAWIEGNNVQYNDRGIHVDGISNTVFKNSAHANGINYVIVADNVYGSIVDRTAPASAAVSGNSAASSAGTTDPWANFAY